MNRNQVDIGIGNHPLTTTTSERTEATTQHTVQLAKVTVLGLMHALVDAASVGLVYSQVHAGTMSYEELCLLIILYNSLAFGLQFMVGWFADWKNNHRLIGGAGLAMLAAAVLLYFVLPVTAIVLGGIGNALFHVGIGGWVLRMSPGRARESGLFVGPGALGLAAGVWLGGCSMTWVPVAAGALLLAIIVLARIKLAEPEAGESVSTQRPRPGIAVAMIGCLFISVAIRALVGGGLSGPWRMSQTHAFILAGIAVAGKSLGGFLADSFGWRRLGISALGITALLLLLPEQRFWTALAAVFVFQFTMPVTLAATYVLIPKHPGVAFGLPCLAILLGAMPGLIGHSHIFHSLSAILSMVAFSTILLWFGLAFKQSMALTPIARPPVTANPPQQLMSEKSNC